MLERSRIIADTPGKNIWIFAYGSLMWNPSFEYLNKCKAELRGMRRSLCITSIHHRGTPEKPGLVLGLDTGGKCTGIAYEVEAHLATDTIKYLRAREQVTRVYREITRPITLLDGSKRQVRSVIYAVDRNHPQYAGDLSFDTQIRMISTGIGKSGNNIDYVMSTAQHLMDAEILDRDMYRLAHSLGRRKCTARR